MPVVSGPLKIVTDKPARVQRVFVRADDTRPYGGGVLTKFNDPVPVSAGGRVSFECVPGLAVLEIVQSGGPRIAVPMVVADAPANQSLEDVVRAGQLLEGRDLDALAAIVKRIQATLQGSEEVSVLVARNASAAAEAAEAADGAARAAATSASQASEAAGAASGSASSATGSASAAASSASTASTAARSAQTAETGAKQARTGAETAQRAAQTAETGAKQARTGAETASSAAAASATEAGNAASRAGTSAGDAKREADRAEKEAGRSETEAGNAAASAQQADKAAGAAAESADAASESATRAASIADSTFWDGDQVTVNGKQSQHLTGPAPTIEISDAGTWVINGADTGRRAIGRDGTVTFEELTEEQRSKLGVQTWGELQDKPTVFPSEWGKIDGKPESFPPEDHTHSVEDVEGLAGALADAQVDWDNLANKPTVFPPEAHGHQGVDVKVLMQGDKPTVVSAQDVLNDHQETLDGLVGRLDDLPAPTWGNLEGKPTVFPPEEHTHDLLKSATDRPTPGTLVKRYTDGTFEVKASTRPNDAVNNAQLETKLKNHTHTSADVTDASNDIGAGKGGKVVKSRDGDGKIFTYTPVDQVNNPMELVAKGYVDSVTADLATKTDLGVLKAQVAQNAQIEVVPKLPSPTKPGVLYVLTEE